MTATIEAPVGLGGFDQQPPPSNIVAERAVLGAMLLSADACAVVLEALKADDFYSGAHRLIFETVVDMYGLGAPVDIVTVGATLDQDRKLTKVGGAPYLHSLIAGLPATASAGYYARLVAEKSVQRKLVEAGMRIAQLGYQGAGAGQTLGDVTTLAQQAVYEVTEREKADDYAFLTDMLQPALDEVEAAGKTGAEMTGVPTGFIDLDRLINGLHGGQLIIVAGRPGSGKSTFGLDVARNAAIRAKLTSAIFSLEMPKVGIVTRLLSAESRVPLHVLRNGQLSDDDWTKLARCMGEIGNAPLIIDDTPSMNLMQIRSKAQRLKQRHDLRLIVVDYLQLMSSPKRTESRQQEVSDLSRGLKLLAKELDVPVIAVAQLNRGPEQRADKRPQLSDLRESGSLEQDADVVILLHRDDYYDKESARAGEADFIIAKHRDGPTDTVTVAAQLHLSRFVDMAIV